jgi:hypothetical protein
MLKRSEQQRLVLLIAIAVALLAGIPFVGILNSPHLTMSKLVGSSGLFFDIAGILQLEISGAFESIMDKYGNVDEYPGGPPSRIARQIIDDPDAPIRTALRNTMFFEHRTGIRLLIVGFALQLGGVWIWV